MDLLLIFAVLGIALLIGLGEIQPTPPEYIMIPTHTQPAPFRTGCLTAVAIAIIGVLAVWLIRSQAAVPAW